MIKEAIGFGNTIDEAREDAILKLGAAEDADVQFDVITFPKKKTLGLFGGRKAEVKAFIELPDIKPKHEKKKNDKANKPVEKAKTINTIGIISVSLKVRQKHLKKAMPLKNTVRL